MKASIATLIICVSLLQISFCFVVAPSHRLTRSQIEKSSVALSLFGNNKNSGYNKPKNAKQMEKAKPTKGGDSQKKAWQKFARIMVTGSPDGISLLGKPQHNWVSGSSYAQPKAHSWTSSYKKNDTDNENSKARK